MVVRHPAGLEVVRGKRKVRTDRTGARRMVRAPPAWDGGDRDAMSPVRVTGVAEEDRKRLPPRRERPVRERRRLPDAVDGLAGLHGLSGVNPARPGFRERSAGMETGYGGPLPPEPLAGTGGIPARLELAPAEPRAVEAGKVEMLDAAGKALDGLHAEADGHSTGTCGGGHCPVPEPDGPRPVAAPAPANAHHAAAPGRLRGTGPNEALMPGAGSPAGSCAAAAGWPASRGWRRSRSRAVAAVTTRGPARRATRCCEVSD